MISRDGDTNIPPAPRLHPRGHDIPLPLSAPQLPRTVLARSTSGSAAQALKAAADELREKQRFMRTPAWEDFSSEEQAKFMHEVYVHHPVLLYPPPLHKSAIFVASPLIPFPNILPVLLLPPFLFSRAYQISYVNRQNQSAGFSSAVASGPLSSHAN